MHKFIAESGLASRKAAEALVAAGRVTVDGEVVNLGARVTSAAAIRVDGEPLPPASTEVRLLMYNKPRGEIVSRDGHGSVFDNLPKLEAGRWLNVGRLDVDTEGLLLLTTDGALAHRLAHPSGNHEREYLVRCKEFIDDSTLARLTTAGFDVAGENVRPSRCTRRENHGNANHWYEVVLKQGRNRIVRRLFEELGAQVNRLVRIRFGEHVMPRELGAGEWLQLKLPADEPAPDPGQAAHA